MLSYTSPGTVTNKNHKSIVGEPRIGLGLPHPQRGVLPLYYSPFFTT